MRFLTALSRLLGGDQPELPPEQRERLLGAWELYSEKVVAISDLSTAAAEPAAGAGAPGSDYDRSHWVKKLKRILNSLPDSQPQWPTLEAEARSLGFGDDWIGNCYREEFVILVRRAIADGAVTAAEHRTLDLARYLMHLSEAEAERIVVEVTEEAAAFFGRPVQGGEAEGVDREVTGL